jgi:hypothetical protein
MYIMHNMHRCIDASDVHGCIDASPAARSLEVNVLDGEAVHASPHALTSVDHFRALVVSAHGVCGRDRNGPVTLWSLLLLSWRLVEGTAPSAVSGLFSTRFIPTLATFFARGRSVLHDEVVLLDESRRLQGC